MNEQDFFNSLELMQVGLKNLEVNRAFNSIGSNIFLEFGNNQEVLLSNGKKDLQKEWIIWISQASWRITKNEKYVVGSAENIKINIQSYLQKLLGKNFHSFHFLSQFLDAEFSFEDGYQLTTFFNYMSDNQWTVFLPDQSEISVDCSNRDSIKKMQTLLNYPIVKEIYKILDLPIGGIRINEITYSRNNALNFLCDNAISIHFKPWAWRLEKDNVYQIGSLDNKSDIRKALAVLIGKKIEKIEIVNLMMDARFQIEDKYILKKFTCHQALNQWNVCFKDKILFSADIQFSG